MTTPTVKDLTLFNIVLKGTLTELITALTAETDVHSFLPNLAQCY